MAESKETPKEATTEAEILSYRSTHVAIAKIHGKTFKVNIPVNSNHPPVGKAALKDKFRREELTKDDLAAFEAKREESKAKAEGKKVEEKK